MAIPTLSGPMLSPASGKAPTSIIVFLHGLGADGNDLIGIGDEIAELFPDTLFTSPDAPFPCDMAPYGRQWFSLLDRSMDAMLEGVEQAVPILNQYLDSLLAQHSLAPSKMALVGFSQGTMTSLHAAPRRAEALAGVVGFSGALVAPHLLESEIKSRPPICLIHGDADEIVPFAAMPAAHAALDAVKINVESHRRPGLSHGIDGEGLHIAVNFLKERLG